MCRIELIRVCLILYELFEYWWLERGKRLINSKSIVLSWTRTRDTTRNTSLSTCNQKGLWNVRVGDTPTYYSLSWEYSEESQLSSDLQRISSWVLRGKNPLLLLPHVFSFYQNWKREPIVRGSSILRGRWTDTEREPLPSQHSHIPHSHYYDKFGTSMWFLIGPLGIASLSPSRSIHHQMKRPMQGWDGNTNERDIQGFTLHSSHRGKESYEIS